ncbi:MAG TPA: 6,7-dimethyl-8-ribityllumazine synthase, partial [Lautropia sp.]|nr:6,7-dimethyl-8-ribityllumazine synthase [Lautropia sp.]
AICDALSSACLAELLALGVAEADTLLCNVPGALEIPTALLQLGRSGEFDVLIALGSVVKGETYHFEVVSNESAAGVSRVALELGIPIANAILTTYTEEQAVARATEKGAEAARVAVEMANLSAAIESIAEDPHP